MVNNVELVEFFGGLTANARIMGHAGWRGPGKIVIREEGIEFSLGLGFDALGNRRYVKRSDLAYVYPVQARRLSLTSLVASVIPRLSNTAIRFVTQSVGLSADRDDYIFFSYRHEEWAIIDVLEELGYPVDRKSKTMRFYWENEAG